jgi:Rod binding domain-containing protein
MLISDYLAAALPSGAGAGDSPAAASAKPSARFHAGSASAMAESASAVGAQETAQQTTQDAKLKKAAGDFESILLASLWKSMKHSFSPEGSDDDSDPAHGTLDDWSIEIMAGAVGRAGGLGLGKLVLEHLEPGNQENTIPAAEAKMRGRGREKISKTPPADPENH